MIHEGTAVARLLGQAGGAAIGARTGHLGLKGACRLAQLVEGRIETVLILVDRRQGRAGPGHFDVLDAAHTHQILDCPLGHGLGLGELALAKLDARQIHGVVSGGGGIGA